MTPSGPEALCLREGVQTAHLGLVRQLSRQEAAGMGTDSVGTDTCPPRHCGVPITQLGWRWRGAGGGTEHMRQVLARQSGPVPASTQYRRHRGGKWGLKWQLEPSLATNCGVLLLLDFSSQL